MTEDIAFLSVAEASRRIAAGTLTSTDLTNRVLERIEKYEPKLGAFVTVYADEARAAAEAADKALASGHRVGPLHGIPIALKDIVDLEGRVTTGGCKVWENRVSPVTATLAERLIGAGMIVIGKTKTVEFAMGGWGTNTHMGTPWNPWDLDVKRTPGGSSAGSGVSVAAGLAPCAIGTDTGGSVRLPAAWCGHAGLKVTIGRISTYGVLPLSHTLDTPGPMTRTVEDAAMLYAVMQGPDGRDENTSNAAPFEDPMPHLDRGVEGLALGVLTETERQHVDAEILAAYDASIETFARLGARIVPVDLPRRFVDLGRSTGNIIGAEGYYHVGHLVDDDSLPIDPDIKPRIWIGRGMEAKDYIAALFEQQKIKAEFAPALDSVDAMLTPTTSTAAIVVDEVDQSGTPAIFTRAVNILERCALSLPNGFTPGGLPTSLHIIAKPYDEVMALRIGQAYEQATDFHGRVPPGLE